MRILLIEDEMELASAIQSALEKRRMAVDHVSTLSTARYAINEVTYKLALLDRKLPDGDGISIIPHLRASAPGVAIIVLSAMCDVTARVEGLDAGADDYLPKPFSMDELVARLRALDRRPAVLRDPQESIGRLVFDFEAKEALVNGERLALQRRELLVLQALIERRDKTVRRESLSTQVYGFERDIASNALDSHVSNLRRKLDHADAGVEIHTMRGIGYLIRAKDA
ncbi:MAG: response regulator transcription factor [Paraburkholderia sp.]|jgi:DNA-binding response OmpR family regulator|uniref:response regulator transcription factor n=1 Tax=Burkholderiaceae TaxID=119060 RepID=UPI0010F58E04|nr:response regulator transcription factor [Burkholderia sp. 4M9327F10]